MSFGRAERITSPHDREYQTGRKSFAIQPASTPSSMDSKPAPSIERDSRLWADTPQNLRQLLQDQRNTRLIIAIIRPRQASLSLGRTRKESPTERRLRINTTLSSRPSSPKQNLSRLAEQIDSLTLLLMQFQGQALTSRPNISPQAFLYT